MTVLIGRKQVGVALKYNQGGSASINNQDKTITKNGVYTADEGYTGLGTVEVNVESSGDGSDTFEAQLILDNVVNSGTLKTEQEVVNETVAVLRNVTGE